MQHCKVIYKEQGQLKSAHFTALRSEEGLVRQIFITQNPTAEIVLIEYEELENSSTQNLNRAKRDFNQRVSCKNKSIK